MQREARLFQHDPVFGVRRVLKGALPTRALSLVRFWARMHEVDLLAAWASAPSDVPLRPIPPLKRGACMRHEILRIESAELAGPHVLFRRWGWSAVEGVVAHERRSFAADLEGER